MFQISSGASSTNEFDDAASLRS